MHMTRGLIFLFFAFLSFHGIAQEGTFNNAEGAAIKGYDPVAYFTMGKAVPGSDKFKFEWSGSQWKFSSQANLDSFKADPAKYAPQYGGWCAYGCSENHKAPTDPNAFTIVNNKLYLNYSLKVKELWLKDTASRIITADAYWGSLKK
jgi:YHS domain-containing protein